MIGQVLSDWRGWTLVALVVMAWHFIVRPLAPEAPAGDFNLLLVWLVVQFAASVAIAVVGLIAAKAAWEWLLQIFR